MEQFAWPQVEHFGWPLGMLREEFVVMDIPVLETYETDLNEGHKGRSEIIGPVATRNVSAR